MKVRGDLKPNSSFTLEEQPKKPGFYLARFYENAKPIEEQHDGFTITGWEYDEYYLEFPESEDLQQKIANNLPVYLQQARAADPEASKRVSPETLQSEILTAMIAAQINTLSVDNATALRWKSYYPAWEAGQSYAVGYKVREWDRLYQCLQAHTSQEDWRPSATPSLWVGIDETHAGTEDDPIPYNGNMALENGKYYTQDSVLYRCFRDTLNPVYNPLSELVGLYVERV